MIWGKNSIFLCVGKRGAEIKAGRCPDEGSGLREEISGKSDYSAGVRCTVKYWIYGFSVGSGV